MNEIVSKALAQHKKLAVVLENDWQLIEDIANLFIATIKQKGKIIFMGNGGSAADAQHLAAELVGRFKVNRAPLAALALSTDSSILTAVGNDFGFQDVFSRQVEALATGTDCVVGISTSGKSENVILAIEKAKQIGAKTVGFLGGDGGAIAQKTDLSLIVSVKDTPRIQEIHILAGHIICEIVEQAFC